MNNTCLVKDRTAEATYPDKPTRVKPMEGLTFGRLTVLECIGVNNKKGAIWLCSCDCGNTIHVYRDTLVQGYTKSCGCLVSAVAKVNGRKTKTHGHRRVDGKATPEYRAWRAMKGRCLNTAHKDYPKYGAAGITLCEEWHKFENFLADMGTRPAGTSIDRIDNTKGYSPDNCRWASPKQQSRNRKSNKLVVFNGNTMTLAEFTEVSGLPKHVAYDRVVKLNWPLDKAANTPVRCVRQRA